MADISRTWATIVYQESCSKDWIEKLENLKIPCYVSPLHDKDVTEDGISKKAHWHVLMMFQGQKNRKNIQELVQVFGGVGAEQVHSKESYIMYLCHLKSPKKHVYDVSEVLSLNGATEYTEIVKDNINNKYELMNQMLEWCNLNTIYFVDLVDYARNNRPDWFKVLVDKNSYLIWEYIKSKAWKNSKDLY